MLLLFGIFMKFVCRSPNDFARFEIDRYFGIVCYNCFSCFLWDDIVFYNQKGVELKVMELVVYFKLDHPYLEKAYQSTFYSFLKQVLEDEDNEKYMELFGKKDAKIKKFCFYVRMMSPVFQDDLIQFENSFVEMHIRDFDEIELYQFYNAFLSAFKKKKMFPMNLNQARIMGVKLKPLQKEEESTLYIKFLSPMVVKEHFKESNRIIYYTYQDNEFINKLKRVIQNTYETLGYSFSMDDFELIPVNPKKTVVSIYGVHIPVSIGSYILKGNKDLLNFLYLKGMGNLSGSGFGAFKIIGKEK